MQLQDFLLDFFDVAIVAWIFYRMLLVFRQTRAIRVVLGLVLLALVYWMATLMRFEGLLGLVDALRGNRLEIGVVILAVIFSEEIRDAMSGMFWRFSGRGEQSRAEKMVDSVSRACTALASRGTGALIAIARENPLERWILADSVAVDAAVSSQLLETIFAGKSPLHDGAVIIRDCRIASAKCQFPASSDPAVTKLNVGMRHRAAVGIAERSDAIALTVSEERHSISVAHRGKLHENISSEELPKMLRKLLELKSVRRAWYHPVQLAQHGWLKLLAGLLALGVWGEQETTVQVETPLMVRDAEGERSFALTDGQLVLTPASQLKPLADGTYAQLLEPVQVELLGANRTRLRLLPSLLAAWLRGEPASATELFGPLFVLFPEDASVAGKSEVLEVGYEGAFTLKDVTIQVQVDELEWLPATAFAARVQGEPDSGYARSGREGKPLPAQSPTPVKLIRAQKLVLPRGLIESMGVSLRDLPTVPAIKVHGHKSFEFFATLEVPRALRLWNPEETFEARVFLDILSESFLRELEKQSLSDDQRRELEAQRADAQRLRDERRNLWTELERKLPDNSWEQDYRLDTYISLSERVLPDLKKRIEKAEIDLLAVESKISRIDAESASAETRAQIELRLFARERELRAEFLTALREQRDYVMLAVSAVAERIKPLLDAVDRAVRQKEQIATAESALPAVDREADLQVLVGVGGPAGLATTEGAPAIAERASSRSTLLLLSRAGTVFERWNDSLREMRGLLRELDDLRKQLAGTMQPTATRIRLELQLLEKEALLEGRRMTARRQAVLWADLGQRLEQGLDIYTTETELLARLVLSWPSAEVEKLELEPFVNLFRALCAELPSIAATRQFLDEQLPRTLNTPLPSLSQVTDELLLYRTEVTELREAADAVALTWQYYAEGTRLRLAALASIAARIVDSAAAASSQVELDRLAVDLNALESDARDTRRLLQECAADPLSKIKLDDLDSTAVQLQTIDRLILAKATRVAELEASTKRLNDQLAALQPGDPSAQRALVVRWCLEATRLQYHEAGLRRLRVRRDRLKDLEGLLGPILQPLIANLKSRQAEHQQLAQAPQPERQAAQSYLQQRRATEIPLTELQAELPVRLDAAVTDSLAVAQDLASVFKPLPDDDQGFEYIVALETRRDRVQKLVDGLKQVTTEERPDPEAGRGLAQAELRRRIRLSELAMRSERLRLLEESLSGLHTYLFDTSGLSRFVEQCLVELTRARAVRLPLAPLEAVLSTLEQTELLREAQWKEARDEADRREAADRPPFEHRAAALETRLGRLKKTREELQRLLEHLRRLRI